jgi:hypothetical protein
MDTHKNAPLTPKGREAMVRSVVEGGLSKASAARQFNVTPKTVAKWFGRSAQTAQTVCGIVPHGPIHCQAKLLQPHVLPSRRYAGGAIRASRSLANLEYRTRPSALATPFKSKTRLEAENAVLRHQLIVLRRRLQGRVRLTNNDRWFSILLYRWFPSILQVVTIMRPETLVRWHGSGYRCYWR